MKLNLLNRMLEYLDRIDINNTKRAYVDCLQYAIGEIIDNKNKVSTGINKRPKEYNIKVVDNRIMPVDLVHLPRGYSDYANKIQSEHILDKYYEMYKQYKKHVIEISINNDNKKNKSSYNMEITLFDHIRNYEKKFDINSVDDYKNARKEICEYIQHGPGSWVYTWKQGKLF